MDITVSADISGRSFQHLNHRIQSDHHFNVKKNVWKYKNCLSDIDLSKRHKIYQGSFESSKNCFQFMRRKKNQKMSFVSSSRSFQNKGLSKWRIFKRRLINFIDGFLI